MDLPGVFVPADEEARAIRGDDRAMLIAATLRHRTSTFRPSRCGAAFRGDPLREEIQRRRVAGENRRAPDQPRSALPIRREQDLLPLVFVEWRPTRNSPRQRQALLGPSGSWVSFRGDALEHERGATLGQLLPKDQRTTATVGNDVGEIREQVALVDTQTVDRPPRVELTLEEHARGADALSPVELLFAPRHHRRLAIARDRGNTALAWSRAHDHAFGRPARGDAARRQHALDPDFSADTDPGDQCPAGLIRGHEALRRSSWTDGADRQPGRGPARRDLAPCADALHGDRPVVEPHDVRAATAIGSRGAMGAP